jgi:hypothetical protein
LITAQEELDEYIRRIDLTIDCKFKPWDGKGEACLKWDVTLRYHKDSILTCEYTAGVGHCPSYPAYAAFDECVTGQGPRQNGQNGTPIRPDIKDFVQSICLDSSALDYGSFEEWAREYGYDEDSRKAEKMYRECLKHAIMLRASLGREKFDHLCHLCSQL